MLANVIKNIENKKNLNNLTLLLVVSVLLQKTIISVIVYLVQSYTSGDPLATKIVYYPLPLISSVHMSTVFLITSIILSQNHDNKINFILYKK